MRRPNGSGSVLDRGDGSFLLRWPERGERRSRVVRCGTEAEALELLDAILLELGEDGAEVTFAAFGERWLDHAEAAGRGDIAACRSRWRLHVAPQRWARLPLGAVRPRHLKRWLKALERVGLGEQHRRHCAYLVSGIFREALEEELVTRNPMEAISKPGLPASRRAIVLTAAQIAALDLDEILPTIALALVGCCLRPGELLGMRIEDDRGDHLLVRRSGRAQRQQGRTKTGQGEVRRVELFGWGATALERWRRLRPSLKGRGWAAARSPWLFPVPPVWLRALPLPAGVHAHDCRGTGATHLLSGTWGEPWTIADVAAFIGDSIATTERAYAHVVGGRLAALGRGIRVGSGPERETVKNRAMLLRARRDSNARPLASEALAFSQRAPTDSTAQILRGSRVAELAFRYAEAVERGDPHRDMRGLDLVAAILGEDARAGAVQEATG